MEISFQNSVQKHERKGKIKGQIVFERRKERIGEFILKETLKDKNKFCLLHNLTHGALPDWGPCKRVRQIFLHIPEIPLVVLPVVSHQ